MKVVNLARRPFVNRRPVFRFALLLWVLGVVLLAVNTRLYYRHWQGSAEIRQQLAEVDRALAEQAAVVERERLRIERVNLRALNGRVAFLNSLISYRTFPWSALFDDLEEVMPDDVRLVDVQPLVRLASDVERSERRGSRQPRAAAGSEQRQRLVRRAREGARQGGDEPVAEENGSEASRVADSAATSAANSRARETEEELAPDEVRLRLTGFAEREELILELVDALYADPSFRRPVLGSESLDRNQGPEASNFNLSVVYLTRVPTAPAEPVIVGSTGPVSGAATPGAAPPAVPGSEGAMPQSGAASSGRRPRSGADAGPASAPASAQNRSPARAGAAAPPASVEPRAHGAPGSAASALGPSASRQGASAGVARSGTARPGAARPGAARPGAARPGAARPGAARRDAVPSGTARAASEDPRREPTGARPERDDAESDVAVDDAPDLREPDASSSPELDRGARLSSPDAFGRLAILPPRKTPATRGRG